MSQAPTAHYKVRHLGQVFTPPTIVHRMLALRQHKTGPILEPSAGAGAFLSCLESAAIGLEIDPQVVVAAGDDRLIAGDFFAYPTAHRFASIIGNPPYVRYQDIDNATKTRLPMEWFDRRSNLYLFFIAKCMAHLGDGGELIFITPRDFLKATSARLLNKNLHSQGSFTHYYELGDSKIFDGYSPNCAIWRWQKGRRNRNMKTGGDFCYRDGQIWFGSDSQGRLGDEFEVKVGAVSGADGIFTHQKHGNVDFVCSATRRHGNTRRMIYNQKTPYLDAYKAALLHRRIRHFDDSNWWQWGRKYHANPGPRIYVNCKTRHAKPFFTHPATAYDGSVLALFPKPI